MLKSEEAFPMIQVPALESFNKKRKFEDDDQQFDGDLPSSKHHYQLRDAADQSPTNTDHFFTGGGDSDATAASLHVHVGEGRSREEGSCDSSINGVSDQEEELLDNQLTNYSQNFEGGGNPDLMEDALLCYGLSYTDLLNLEPDHYQRQQQQLVVEKAMDEDEDEEGKEEEDLSSPFTIILSERWGIKQRDAEAPPPPTIDQEFEQYFSKLMLQD